MINTAQALLTAMIRACSAVEPKRPVFTRTNSRSHPVARQADDGELVAMGSKRHLVAEGKTGRAVDDHLVMAAHNPSTGSELAGATRPARLVADDEEAQRHAPELRLDRLDPARSTP